MGKHQAPSGHVFGFHPLRELLRREPQAVAEVWLAGRAGQRRAEIEALCQRHGVAVRRMPSARLDELAAGATHNGFAATRRAVPSVEPVGGDPELVVLVEDIQDPRNLGALIRVCEGVGVGRLLVRDRGSAPLTPAAIKTSAGAVEWLPVERIVNSSRVIEELKAKGYWVYGADAAGEPPWAIDLTGPLVLCLGGEEKGLRPLTRQHCDGLVGLPMQGRVESLNLATAAAALLYDALRQRIQGREGSE